MRAQARIAVLANHLNQSAQIPSSPSFQDCCGIVAVINPDGPVINYLLEGLKILEARGYDSAGITTLKDHEFITTKFASSGSTHNAIQILEKHSAKHSRSNIGIAHTRWATHGGATDVNAHPHSDHWDRIVVCHNGVIENFADLKKWLQTEHKVEFKSETDTEVIAQMIGLFVHQGTSLVDAVNKTLDKLRGTWGLVVMDKQSPDTVVVAKNGSPMVIGLGAGKTFAASEPSAFSRHTKEYIALEDGEVAVLKGTEHSLDRTRVEIAQTQKIETSPDPYPFWTIKEIMEQPEAVSRALNYGGRLFGDDGAKLGGLERNKEKLSQVKNLVIAACGTSMYAGLGGAHYMRFLNVFDSVQVIDAAELEDTSLPLQNAALLVISQSGETKDVHRALTVALEKDIPVLSIVNAVGSLIARSTDCGVFLNAGRENAVASTKAFTATLTVLCLIALWFSKLKQKEVKVEKRQLMVEALHRLPTNIGMTLRSPVVTQVQKIASEILASKFKNMFILGKGAAFPIALEGALKIKEISYIHAEGFSGGALKHGPFALIEAGLPIIFIILDDQHAGKMKVAVEEVRARGARTITITNVRGIYKSYTNDMGDVIQIPSNGPLTNVLAVLPLQLLAYELSLQQGINPDRPRHLAKTVTVD